MSLRWRLLCLCAGFVALVCALGGAVLVVNAREAVRAEMMSALALAEALATRVPAGSGAGLEASLSAFGLRHVRFTDAAGDHGASGREVGGEGAPDWFVAAIGVPPVERRVAAGGGSVTLVAEPWDEIDEVWEDVTGLGRLVLPLSVAALALAHWSIGRSLRPLLAFERGLERMRRGDFAVGFQRGGVPELARIGTRIETLARALARSEEENRRLGRQIVAVQERERSDLAREIHDELGPSLFSIKVDAGRIVRLAGTGSAAGEAGERAQAILAVADTVNRLSRRILTRLRPVVLDHMPLSEALEEMVAAHRSHHPGIDWQVDLDAGIDALTDPLRVTVYRLVQESATNALRHAGATRVAVTVGGTGPSGVLVAVEDDGVGPGVEPERGFGVSGMLDRVQALGGSLEIAAVAGGGTAVRARIPVPRMGEASGA